jgi:exodeoxyribonuclease VII small subunit
MNEDDAEKTFESLARELEEIVGKLERGDVPLDQAIVLWQRGEVLYGLCRSRLDSAQGSIEQISSENAAN